MKEDYLWDKTGKDPEMERLENALQAFRFAEAAPPALPAKIIPFETKTPRKFFRLAFAFAACAVFVIVALGVWLKVSNDKIQIAEDSTRTTAPQIKKNISDEVSVKKQDEAIVKKVEVSKQSVERKVVRTYKSVSAISRQNNLTAQNARIKKPTIKLTKEENYAYSQLMLALSITSSKLKLVKDKVEGGEKQNAVLESGQ